MSQRHDTPPPDMLYLPSRQARVSAIEYKTRMAGRKLSWDVPIVDRYMTPLMGGDLMSVLARPGHTKTTTLIHLAKAAERQLASDGMWVVFVTWETLVEEFVAILTAGKSGQSMEDIARGQAELGKIGNELASLVANSGIVVIGMSYEMKSRTIITLEDVDECLWWLEDNGYPPGLLIMDYLQRMPWNHHSRDKTSGVSENLERCKSMLITHRLPGAVAVQARRDVDNQSGLKLPRLGDGQWSSNVEQTSDKVIALTRPSNYLELATPIDSPTGETYETQSETIVMGWLKQRWGPAGGRHVLDLDVKTATLKEAVPLVPAF